MAADKLWPSRQRTLKFGDNRRFGASNIRDQRVCGTNFSDAANDVHDSLHRNADQYEIRIANAGHPAPIWRVQDQTGTHFELCPIDDIGPALGLIPEEEFRSNRFTLNEMTELLFFTDGIIEQKTKSGEEWGVENLEEAVLDHESDELPEQLRAISEELKEVAGARELSDDVCIIAVRLSPTETK